MREVHLLVHPFYRMQDKQVMETRYSQWVESARSASERNAYGVVLETSDGDSKQQTRLIDAIHKIFGKNFRSIGPGLISKDMFNDKGIVKVASSGKVNISGRGVYTELCVVEALQMLTKQYDIPHSSATINLAESVDGLSVYDKIANKLAALRKRGQNWSLVDGVKELEDLSCVT